MKGFTDAEGHLEGATQGDVQVLLVSTTSTSGRL